MFSPLRPTSVMNARERPRAIASFDVLSHVIMLKVGKVSGCRDTVQPFLTQGVCLVNKLSPTHEKDDQATKDGCVPCRTEEVCNLLDTADPQRESEELV